MFEKASYTAQMAADAMPGAAHWRVAFPFILTPALGVGTVDSECPSVRKLGAALSAFVGPWKWAGPLAVKGFDWLAGQACRVVEGSEHCCAQRGEAGLCLCYDTLSLAEALLDRLTKLNL